MRDSILCRYREIGPERRKEFLSVGYKQRHVFAHQIYYLPKCGPDGLRLARNMCGSCELNELNEIVLYAHPSELAEFPEKIFFDDELCWHQQQFGKIGQVAAVDLVWRGTELYSMAHQSDVVQRATRRRQFRTRLQNVFKGWSYMLLNALLNFAVEHSVQAIFIPTASLALRNTDPARKVQRALFERIYNQQVQTLFRATAAGEWWKVDVQENLHRLIRPEIKSEPRPREKVICLCHDVERGFGHLDSDPQFAQAAERSSVAGLAEMLRVERAMGVHATYNVVGRLLPDLRETIESQGHCLAFHSYDHRAFEKSRQLARCRTIDYRLKGYRPPQSKITAELSDENLCYYNFEWLASSSYSLGIHAPKMVNRLVKIPIEFDDYELYRSSMDWQAWKKQALDAIERSDFIAFSMHDCYSQFWLTHYQRFLEKVCSLGRLQTMNEVLNQTLMSHAI